MYNNNTHIGRPAEAPWAAAMPDQANYITLHYITLHYPTLHYITLHYIALNYITLHYQLYYITLPWAAAMPDQAARRGIIIIISPGERKRGDEKRRDRTSKQKYTTNKHKQT